MVRSRALLLSLSGSFLLAGGLYACSDDSSPVTPTTDAGTDAATDTGTPDTSTPDATPDAPPPDAGPRPENGKILMVHASPNLDAVRFCFGISTGDAGTTTVSPQVAQPNLPHGGLPIPGMPPGAGGVAPDTTDLTNFVVTPFIIPAALIADQNADGGPDGSAEANCQGLIGADGSGGILQSSQYYKLAPIPAGTFLPGTTTLVALTGCAPGGTANETTATCGEGYTRTDGNLKAQTFKLDRSATNATKTGAQVFHVASPWDGIIADEAQTSVAQVVSLFTRPDGGGIPTAIAPIVSPPGVTYKTVVAPDASVSIDSTAFDPTNLIGVSTIDLAVLNAGDAGTDAGEDAGADAGEDAGDAGSGRQLVLNTTFLPLGAVALLSNGTGTSPDGGPYFNAGVNYAFILLGSPAAEQLVLPDGGRNPAYVGKGLHVLAFPTNPPFPKASEF